jgi:hypothetical protein
MGEFQQGIVAGGVEVKMKRAEVDGRVKHNIYANTS